MIGLAQNSGEGFITTYMHKNEGCSAPLGNVWVRIWGSNLNAAILVNKRYQRRDERWNGSRSNGLAGVKVVWLELQEWEPFLCCSVCMETRIYLRGWFHEISNHGFPCTSKNFAFGACSFDPLGNLRKKYLGKDTSQFHHFSWVFCSGCGSNSMQKPLNNSRFSFQNLHGKVRFFWNKCAQSCSSFLF